MPTSCQPFYCELLESKKATCERRGRGRGRGRGAGGIPRKGTKSGVQPLDPLLGRVAVEGDEKGMVLYGNGVVWSMVWCGMVMVWCGNGMVWCGVVW